MRSVLSFVQPVVYRVWAKKTNNGEEKYHPLLSQSYQRKFVLYLKYMRPAFLLLLLVLMSYMDSHAIIGIGYSHKKVLFWRFWEAKEGTAVPEILVYNT